MPSIRAVMSVLRGDLEGRYTVAERLARRISPEAVLSERGRIWLADKDFRRAYERFDAENLRRMDRLYTLDQLARWAAAMPGNSAECGTYQGASSWFVCRRLAGTGKDHHVFDSFAGLSMPGEMDGTFWQPGSLSSPEDIARSNLEDFDFVSFHPGWIPERFPEVAEEWFCLLHIDVDLHDPTLASLEFFYPRLVPGAIVVLDDYGFATCPGARKAVDDFFADRREQVIDLPTGQGLVFKL